MDSWGEIQGVLEYQAVDNGALTPVDTMIFKYKKGKYPDEPCLI